MEEIVNLIGADESALILVIKSKIFFLQNLQKKLKL